MTPEPNPRVSIIVTTLNSERTLERCLASIRAQTHANVELLVVDNFSQDRTCEIAGRYADRVIQAGPERSAQRNIGVRESTGRYVFIIDSDMYLGADVVERSLEKAASGACAVVVPEQSHGKGFWAACKAFERSFYHSDQTVCAPRFFTREAYLGVGGFDEDLVSGEDWDLAIRVSSIGQTAIADALIEHDEGALRLWPLLRKKFYYGKHIRKFIAKHGAQALLRLNPLRAAYSKRADRFLSEPLLGAGMVMMRFCEAVAGGAGLLVSYLRPQ